MSVSYRRSDLIWLVLYVAMLAAVVGGLFYARQRAIAVYGTDRAEAQWNMWRKDVKQQEDGNGPVARQVPKSAEPPALVLMRDYFVVCVVIAIALSSVLFGTFVFLLRGTLDTPTKFVDRSPPERMPDGSD
ncbi:MAG TPA: hypothetical protein VFB96_00100 [Pirellulaceae bacterium]|nr:hypothetical protein [Pirellulaceae bacterium]